MQACINRSSSAYEIPQFQIILLTNSTRQRMGGDLLFLCFHIWRQQMHGDRMGEKAKAKSSASQSWLWEITPKIITTNGLESMFTVQFYDYTLMRVVSLTCAIIGQFNCINIYRMIEHKFIFCSHFLIDRRFVHGRRIPDELMIKKYQAGRTTTSRIANLSSSSFNTCRMQCSRASSITRCITSKFKLCFH